MPTRHRRLLGDRWPRGRAELARPDRTKSLTSHHRRTRPAGPDSPQRRSASTFSGRRPHDGVPLAVLGRVVGRPPLCRRSDSHQLARANDHGHHRGASLLPAAAVGRLTIRLRQQCVTGMVCRSWLKPWLPRARTQSSKSRHPEVDFDLLPRDCGRAGHELCHCRIRG